MDEPYSEADPTPEEQAVLDGLPDAPDAAFYKGLRVREFRTVEKHHNRLTPEQRIAYDEVNAEMAAKIRSIFDASPSFKKVVEQSERTAAKFRAAMPKTPAIKMPPIRPAPNGAGAGTGPLLPQRDRDFVGEVFPGAGELWRQQSAQVERIEEERKAKVEREQAMLDTMGEVLGEIVQQNASGRHVVSLTRAAALFALVSVVVAVVIGVWTFSQMWEWTLLAGIASLGLGVMACGALGVFKR